MWVCVWGGGGVVGEGGVEIKEGTTGPHLQRGAKKSDLFITVITQLKG